MSVSPLRLQPLDLWVQPGDGAPLLPQLLQALAEAAAAQLGPGAEPLRWAITDVDLLRGLRLEGVLVGPARPLVGAEFAPSESDRGLAEPDPELAGPERGPAAPELGLAGPEP